MSDVSLLKNSLFYAISKHANNMRKKNLQTYQELKCIATESAGHHSRAVSWTLQCGQRSQVWPELQSCCASSRKSVLQDSSLNFWTRQTMCPGSHMEWVGSYGKASDCKPWERDLNTPWQLKMHLSGLEVVVLGLVSQGHQDRYQVDEQCWRGEMYSFLLNDFLCFLCALKSWCSSSAISIATEFGKKEPSLY